jgi:hypothetical protein
MMWYKPAEKLPAHEEQVLIREESNRTIYLAIYDESKGVFTLRNGDKIKKSDPLIWMQIAPLPEEARE